jgi:hypothetical protein
MRSLPVPLSPVMSTVTSRGATRSTSADSRLMDAEQYTSERPERMSAAHREGEVPMLEVPGMSIFIPPRAPNPRIGGVFVAREKQ